MFELYVNTAWKSKWYEPTTTNLRQFAKLFPSVVLIVFLMFSPVPRQENGVSVIAKQKQAIVQLNMTSKGCHRPQLCSGVHCALLEIDIWQLYVYVCLNRPLNRAVLKQSGLSLLFVNCMRSHALSSSRLTRNKTRWPSYTNTHTHHHHQKRFWCTNRLTLLWQPLPAPHTEHHPGLEEELWDRQTDYGISCVLPSTRCDGRRKQRSLRFHPGGRSIHLPGGLFLLSLLFLAFSIGCSYFMHLIYFNSFLFLLLIISWIYFFHHVVIILSVILTDDWLIFETLWYRFLCTYCTVYIYNLQFSKKHYNMFVNVDFILRTFLIWLDTGPASLFGCSDVITLLPHSQTYCNLVWVVKACLRTHHPQMCCMHQPFSEYKVKAEEGLRIDSGK